MNKMSGAPVESGAVCTQLSCQDPQVKTEYFLLCITLILYCRATLLGVSKMEILQHLQQYWQT